MISTLLVQGLAASSSSVLNDMFSDGRLQSEIEHFVLFALLGFLPFFLIATTTFTRNIIVLSFLRHALGLQQSPPNMVLITLAMFLTLFTMTPVLKQSYQVGIQPYLDNHMEAGEALDQSWQPIKTFLVRQTHEKDMVFVYRMNGESVPKNVAEVSFEYLVPAFMLSELKTAFKMGFIIFLPFLLVDLVMAAILMSLGMIMVPPITISLPIKVLLFVVIDGWALVSETLLMSVVT
ncbi:flagellar type III secretion system pore protein FliP [Teredinibacter franksiae]|uniref:flagellar type III secretion system pore protein FliP n=1 Tax=Teredinibacter franksiae TaxID=2761453 RepID=UPI00162640C2|nr:flagellar type III secretion system pore protein FliP [Teredinibacter franksiae]